MTAAPSSSVETLLSLRQVAEHCQVSPRTVRRLVKAGALPATRVGRQIRVRRSDLERYLQWRPVR